MDPVINQANIKIVKKEAGMSSSNRTKSKTIVKRKIDKDSIINLDKKEQEQLKPLQFLKK